MHSVDSLSVLKPSVMNNVDAVDKVTNEAKKIVMKNDEQLAKNDETGRTRQRLLRVCKIRLNDSGQFKSYGTGKIIKDGDGAQVPLCVEISY